MPDLIRHPERQDWREEGDCHDCREAGGTAMPGAIAEEAAVAGDSKSR